MRLTGLITEASRLLPASAGRMAAPAATPAAVRPVAPVVPRPAIWSLSRETASAACAVQMLHVQRRGLKADADERARFARSYLDALGLRWNDLFPQTGHTANDTL